VAPTASVSVDSNFPSRYGPGYYDAKFAIDGKEGLPSKGVWVSAEKPGEHFLELRFERARRARGLVVTWARDAQHDWVPQEFSLQVYARGAWKTVLAARDNHEAATVLKLEPPEEVERVRVVITRGSSARPLMGAINEIEVLAVRE
jgi:hypothetical protein